MNMNLGDTRLIVEAGKKEGLPRNELAYVLATSYWETGRTMKPVKEAYWVDNAETWRKKNLRYWPWYGRGYVQLTWERNYKFASGKLSHDFVARPDDALRSDLAVKILIRGMIEGWFTGKKLSDYITLSKSDFVNARRIINGTDKAKTIADIAVKYDAALKADGYGENESPVVSKPGDAVIDDADKPLGKSTTFWSAIGGAITTMFSAIANLGPYGQVAIITAGTILALVIIYERKRKAGLARTEREAMEAE
jgi:hypothetical protein